MHEFDPASGYKPRTEGEIRVRGRDFIGFRVVIIFNFSNQAAVSLHVNRGYRHFVFPLIPEIKLRID